MSSVNKVILVGRLGQAPDVKYLDNNRVVAKLSLATSESYKDREGNKQEQTEWHNIEIWGELAKVAEKYLKKGDMAFIEGKITTQKWTDNDGNEKRSTIIRCNNLTMLSGGSTSTNSNSSNTANTDPYNGDPAGDLPF